MGFLRWVKDRVTRAAHTPIAILSELHTVTRVLWHVLTGLGHNVRTAWSAMLTGAKDIGFWANELAGATYSRLRELFTVTIPHAISHTLAEAWRRAHAAISELRTWAHAAEVYVLHYARGIVADLRGWAQGAVRWLTTHVNDLRVRAGRLERRVFSLLDAPEHLAAWAGAALWRWSWRYAHRYEKAIARWLLRNAVHLALRSAREVEAAIAEII